MRRLANHDIRLKARGLGVPMWAICKELGISEPTLTRWMRDELVPEKRAKILEVIDYLAEQEVEHEHAS